MKQFWTRRWLIGLAVSVALLLSVSGCAGGAAQPTSWTGLTIVGERLYAADIEQVVALNGTDGDPLWAFPDDPKEDRRGVFHVTPAVGAGYVIVASQVPASGFLSQPSNVVWALDADTGSKLWRFDGATGQYIEGGAIGDGIFVIGNSDGNVYALDVESGTLRWTFETGHRVWTTPLIVSDIVYIGSMDRHLYALDLSTGEIRWSFNAEGAFAGTPVLRDGTLYIGAFDDRLYAVDAHTGVERWRVAGENWFWGSPAVYSDTVYAADVNGNVYAVHADTGEQIWHQSLDAEVRAGPALTADGSMLFIGSQNGTLYALDSADGFVLWQRASDEGQMLSSSVVSGSLVYEPLLYGPYRIWALHVDNGREMWAYPPVVEE
ncbi:MAG: PQQ-binding-like beta-propeller repeat protein [Chloroflexota bacterium]|nr:PQQ-binding-like beta-propeller repeat protein [Chloroflexota bacterium]